MSKIEEGRCVEMVWSSVAVAWSTAEARQWLEIPAAQSLLVVVAQQGLSVSCCSSQ